MTATTSIDPRRRPSAIARARRAAVADRYAAGALAVEWRSLLELQSIESEWRELAARALEPNIFYEPAFALPAARVFGRDAGAVLVWSGTSPRQLLGFFPARIARRRYGLKLPVLVGWTHPYAPLGTPLVEREAAEPVIAAWLGHLADGTALPGLVLLPLLPADGPFAIVLDAIIRRAQMPAADFNRQERAQLMPHDDRLTYVERTLGQRRHKELRRYVRRLADIGAILFTSATEPLPVAAALADFFTLEQRGWKGEAGTARFAARRHPRFHHRGGRRAGGARQGHPQPHLHRRPRHWRHHHAAQCRHRLVLEDRLRRDLRPVFAGRGAHLRRHRGSGRGFVARAHQFLRHRQSSDDRPHLARAPDAVRPVDRGAAAGLVFIGRRLETLRNAAIGAAKAAREQIHRGLEGC